jgi:hypothetical protein
MVENSSKAQSSINYNNKYPGKYYTSQDCIDSTAPVFAAPTSLSRLSTKTASDLEQSGYNTLPGPTLPASIPGDIAFPLAGVPKR